MTVSRNRKLIFFANIYYLVRTEPVLEISLVGSQFSQIVFQGSEGDPEGSGQEAGSALHPGRELR